MNDAKRTKLSTVFILWAAAGAFLLVSCRSRLEQAEPEKSTVSVPEPEQPVVSVPEPEEQAVSVPAEVPQSPQNTALAGKKSKLESLRFSRHLSAAAGHRGGAAFMGSGSYAYAPEYNTERYDVINENGYHEAAKDLLSTFSIDVDAASYANTRRFLGENRLPPKDAVRTEEFINYFSYDYPEPKPGEPFSISAEVADCPWAGRHKLVRIGLKSKEVKTKDLPPNNLVFLIDVSGSMSSPDKLPLLQSAFRLLVKELRPQDQVAIAVYAGSAGLVLEPTSGGRKDRILEAIDRLEAGGSTAGGEGIVLAYETARKSFLKKGNNRVILATDGDFNVGLSSDAELVRLVEGKRKSGVFLTVLGFGRGNVNDSMMEKLADKGNGNYAYIDGLLEAKKVLVKEMGATLLAVAKDVKVQVEFNPAKVSAYRLIGYENRMLDKKDFNDDKKDAGELGAGHEVTALYEVIPAGVKEDLPTVDPLKYQKPAEVSGAAASGELMTVKLRYKDPQGETSRLLTRTVGDASGDISAASQDFRFATAVAEFGMLLRGSEFKGRLVYQDVVELARESMGEDPEGTRAEFLKLVKTARQLAKEGEASGS